MSLVLDVNGLSIRMAYSLRKTPTCEGRGGRLPSCRDSCSTHSLQRRNRWTLSATVSRHPAFMANELGNRLAGEAGFPSPKGGDIPWALLQTRHRPRLGTVGEGTPMGEAERELRRPTCPCRCPYHH
jgi:hypothetical protein